MRILILTQFFDPEPAAIPGMPLASWLRERGHQVEVVTGFPNYPGGHFYPGYEPALWRREDVDGVRINRVPLYPSHDRSGTRRTANYLSFAVSASTLGSALTRRADVAYVYHPPGTVGLPALIWKFARGIPFVYHIQDLWPESVVESGMVGGKRTQRAISWALSRWCQLVYREAERIAVLSPGFKRILIERGVPGDKIEVVRNWVDESVFMPMPRDETLARQLGLYGRFNLVYSGNLGYFQGLDCAIRAATRLRHLDRFQLVFIGSGQAEDSLRAQANRLSLSNVRFLGRRPYAEMGRLNALADALLISLEDRPFFSATIPLKTQVALACGRPVLSSLRGDAADLINVAKAGFTCAPGDDVELAQSVERLYRLPQSVRDSLGEHGRQFYMRELSFDSGAQRLATMLMRAARIAPCSS